MNKIKIVEHVIYYIANELVGTGFELNCVYGTFPGHPCYRMIMFDTISNLSVVIDWDKNTNKLIINCDNRYVYYLQDPDVFIKLRQGFLDCIKERLKE